MDYEIYVSREKKNLGYPRASALIKQAAAKALRAEGVQKAIVSVMLTDEEGIRRVNSDFRAVDSVTDVLSFPLNELKPGAFRAEDCETDPDSGAPMLGDMMICLPRCAAQGEELGHGFERELQYLTVHSVLHLLGYDHIDEGEMKKQMRRREKEIMGDED